MYYFNIFSPSYEQEIQSYEKKPLNTLHIKITLRHSKTDRIKPVPALVSSKVLLITQSLLNYIEPRMDHHYH